MHLSFKSIIESIQCSYLSILIILQSDIDKAHLRLTAAASLLKLARQKRYEEMFSPAQFQLLARTIQVTNQQTI